MGINLLTQWVGAALTSSRGKCSHVGFCCIRSQRNWHKIRDIFASFNVDLTIQFVSPGTLTLCSTVLFVLAILCPGQSVLQWHPRQSPSEFGRNKGYTLTEGRIHFCLFILMLTPKKGPFFLGDEWHLIHLTSMGPGVLSIPLMPPQSTYFLPPAQPSFSQIFSLITLTGAHLLAVIEYWIRHLL